MRNKTTYHKGSSTGQALGSFKFLLLEVEWEEVLISLVLWMPQVIKLCSLMSPRSSPFLCFIVFSSR